MRRISSLIRLNRGVLDLLQVVLLHQRLVLHRSAMPQVLEIGCI